ncbi:MAG TPA: patatin-like phospholipase family protein [Planctomycetota bacterium]|nr:patatin-like phospholipase family protein [Planctomycetota bacterium]
MARPWRALVLGGGGAKGEFELGALEYLAEKGCGFDFFSGVSVGALNASVLAQHAKLGEAVARLKVLWDSIKADSDIYTNPFPGGGIGAGVGALLALASEKGWARDSIHASGPLKALIEKHIQWEDLARSGKIWAVGATSLTDGSYYLVANDKPLLAAAKKEGARLNLTLRRGAEGSIPDKLVEFILASSSMPVLFPPVDIYNHRFVDGGLRDITPLSSAFKAAKTRKTKPVGVVVVVISTSPTLLGPRDANALDSGREIAGRTVDIMAHEILQNDLKFAEACNGRKGYLKAEVMSMRPDREPKVGSLEFGNPETRAELRRHGYEVAKRTFKKAQLAKLKDAVT